jgi:hypothetical protein
MWVDIRIPDKIAHLREFGFGDPVKRSHQILVGSAHERLLLSGG